MKIFSIPISKLQYHSFFDQITKNRAQRYRVFTPNPEILLIAKKDTAYTKLLQEADLLLPDGVGLYLAYQILDSGKSVFQDVLSLPLYTYRLLKEKSKLYEKYGERICGSDLTKALLYFAQENQKEVTIVDLYNPDDAAKVQSQQVFVQKMKEVFPKLILHYYIWKEEEKEHILKNIREGNEQYLFSTLGMKKQEENVMQIMQSCPNVVFGMGVGGSFDYFTGLQKRAPEHVRKLGFEWLYRLVFGPQKLKRVYRLWNAIGVFTCEVLREKAQKPKSSSRA